MRAYITHEGERFTCGCELAVDYGVKEVRWMPCSLLCPNYLSAVRAAKLIGLEVQTVIQ